MHSRIGMNGGLQSIRFSGKNIMDLFAEPGAHTSYARLAYTPHMHSTYAQHICISHMHTTYAQHICISHMHTTYVHCLCALLMCIAYVPVTWQVGDMLIRALHAHNDAHCICALHLRIAFAHCLCAYACLAGGRQDDQRVFEGRCVLAIDGFSYASIFGDALFTCMHTYPMHAYPMHTYPMHAYPMHAYPMHIYPMHT